MGHSWAIFRSDRICHSQWHIVLWVICKPLESDSNYLRVTLTRERISKGMVSYSKVTISSSSSLKNGSKFHLGVTPWVTHECIFKLLEVVILKMDKSGDSFVNSSMIHLATLWVTWETFRLSNGVELLKLKKFNYEKRRLSYYELLKCDYMSY